MFKSSRASRGGQEHIVTAALQAAQIVLSPFTL